MIRFLLLQNRQGKTRLSKWYVAIEESDKRKIENEVHRLITSRDSKFTNFVEFRTYKIIYRRYAGLFFSFCVDTGDNELAYLEGIHLFVEMLDRYFGNVCELDLVFNFHKVYAILDECLLAGEMQETSALVILDRVRELEKMMMVRWRPLHRVARGVPCEAQALATLTAHADHRLTPCSLARSLARSLAPPPRALLQ